MIAKKNKRVSITIDKRLFDILESFGFYRSQFYEAMLILGAETYAKKNGLESYFDDFEWYDHTFID